MLDVLWQVGAVLLALSGVYLLSRKGTWPGIWPVEGEPVILGLLGFVIYAVFLVGASAVSGPLKEDPAALHLAVGGIRLVCIVIAFCILKTLIHRADPMHVIRPKTMREVWPAVTPYVLVLPLMYLITTNVDQQAAVDLMNFEGFSARASLFLSVVIAAPLFEELLFRGFLQG
ncbi:MAG: membrane protease YdiL (CAAX protease family), partial [Planctomycetota bacterium]